MGALAIAGILTCEGGITEPPNQAPGPSGTIPDRVVEVDSAVAVDVARYFTDPDSDTLTYSATSASIATATVTMSGGVATVTGVAKGETTVTVTARDPDGLTAEQRFKVTVPNRAPESVGTIADPEVEVDSAWAVDVAEYFMDPDGDSLEFAVVSSDAALAEVGVTGRTVTVTGVAKGTAIVTVTARDPEGLSAEQRFGVTVPNRGPESVGTIADLEVEVDSAAVVELAEHFVDPDGDSLEYAVVSSDPALAEVGVTGRTVTVTGVAKGTAIVTVTARDPEGLSAEQRFGVTVPNRGPESVGTIPELEVEVDIAVVVEIAAYFADPDGDALEYSAVSSEPGLMLVVATGSEVAVTGVAKGSGTVTVTARDPEGLSAGQEFGVTVPNRAPAAVGTIPELEVEVDIAVVVEIAAYFADPDGDALEYSAVSSEPGLMLVVATGSEVAVTGVAKGSGTVTVTARDPEGLSAELGFGVKVPNRAPAAVGTITDLEVDVDSAWAVDVAEYFTDPDGDALEYVAVSSDTALATVAVTESKVTVTGVAKGSVAVTVTAWDPEELSAELVFGVTVPNRPPRVVETIADLEVQVDSAVAVDVATAFADPDGDGLEYSAASSDPARAALAVTGSTVALMGVAKGSATVTVTAWDPEGLSAGQSFVVRVPNREPEAVEPIADLQVRVDSAVTVDVAGYFTDPDGDALEYSAESSHSTVAAVAVTGSTVTVSGLAKGVATVTLTARDPEGLSAEQSFEVTVPNRAPEVVGSLPDDTVNVGEPVSFDVAGYFADPDGDRLVYSAMSSSTAAARVGVVGSTLTLLGGAAGTATISVTALDPAELAAHHEFVVTVVQPNRAPRPVGTVPNATVWVGSSFSLHVAAYFADADGDDLSYTASSSSADTVTVGVSDSTLTVTGEALGAATITVMAVDPDGLTAPQRFEVTVTEAPNRAPRPVGTIPEQTVDAGGSVSIDVTPYFGDPDQDNLDYSAESSDNMLAGAEASDSLVEVTGHLKGRVTITVTAEDPGGLTATQDFEVEVPNQQPLVAAEIDDLTAFSGRTHRVLLSEVFWDPDGDPLTYAAWSTDSAAARPEVVADTVFVTADSAGVATLAVTGTDPDSLFAADTFDVTVVDPLFDLALGFTGDVTETTRSRIREARDEWEAFLWRTELSDVEVPDPVVCLGLSAGDVGTVDDHLALMHVGSIDGEGGTLAYAGYCYRRKSDSLPIVSAAVFDEADIDRMLSTESLAMVAFHELAHGLGFIRSIWRLNELLDDGEDPHFKGELAIEAFDAAGGADYPDAKVPVSSPDYSHWRESVFEREVMTPRMTLGEANPFSAITVEAMADIGYEVDVSFADDYTLPNTSPPPGAGEEYAESFDLSNDVVSGPVIVLNSDGRVVRVIPAPPGSVVPSFPRRDVRIEPRGPASRAGGGLDRQAPARATMWKSVINRPSVRRSR